MGSIFFNAINSNEVLNMIGPKMRSPNLNFRLLINYKVHIIRFYYLFKISTNGDLNRNMKIFLKYLYSTKLNSNIKINI